MQSTTAPDIGVESDISKGTTNDIIIHPESSMLEEIPEKTETSEKEGDEES